MIRGKTGMGNHKHAMSGHVGPSPAYKQQRARDANALAEAERAKRPVEPMYPTVAEALKARRTKPE